MKEIAQIRKLSLGIFIIPLVGINLCLFISQNPDLLENTFLQVDQIGRSGFSIPYLDGSLSISRASRTFPQYLIFKPAMIIKGGMIAAAPMGDPNASIPTPQPVHYRPMFGSFGRAREATSLTFVSQAFGERLNDLGLRKNISAVGSCRNVSKLDMVLNDYLPQIEVDPESYEVRADGELLTCEPADCLPLAQRYFLF